MEIRPLSAMDISGVLAVERVCFSDPWDFAMLAEMMLSPVFRALVAVEQREVLGFVLGYQVADELQVADLGVKPRCQRQGLGRALMEQYLKTNDFGGRVQSVFLEVRVSNAPAQGLYRSMGFYEIGQRSRYYSDGEDALVLRLDAPETK
jgi:ribosomal-protein-alanine N-acetyltransferase